MRWVAEEFSEEDANRMAEIKMLLKNGPCIGLELRKLYESIHGNSGPFGSLPAECKTCKKKPLL